MYLGWEPRTWCSILLVKVVMDLNPVPGTLDKRWEYTLEYCVRLGNRTTAGDVPVGKHKITDSQV